MDITRSGTHSSARRPADCFTGTVRIDAPFEGGGGLSGATVTFEPSVRTAWHTHPLGQAIIVTFGLGRVQREGGGIEDVRAGDIVFFAGGKKHWHGAGPDADTDTAMSHIAIAEVQDGKVADWLEKISDTDYAGDAD